MATHDRTTNCRHRKQFNEKSHPQKKEDAPDIGFVILNGLLLALDPKACGDCIATIMDGQDYPTFWKWAQPMKKFSVFP